MKKLLRLFIALPTAILLIGLVPSSGQDVTITGYISDSICAAKGANSGHLDCMEKCLATKGAHVVIVVDDDQRIVPIDNPDSVSQHHAHRVALFGYLTNGSFHVVSVRIL